MMITTFSQDQTEEIKLMECICLMHCGMVAAAINVAENILKFLYHFYIGTEVSVLFYIGTEISVLFI